MISGHAIASLSETTTFTVTNSLLPNESITHTLTGMISPRPLGTSAQVNVIVGAVPSSLNENINPSSSLTTPSGRHPLELLAFVLIANKTAEPPVSRTTSTLVSNATTGSLVDLI